MGQDGQQIDSFDFEAHRLRATADFQKVEPLYKEFAEVLRNLLLEAFKANHIQVHSIEARAKAVDSFGRKAFAPSEEDPSKPKYPNPLADMTDLAGARVITFFPRTLQDVDGVIRKEFDVTEKSDRAQVLIKEERFGYASVHYLVRLKDNRTSLLEYRRFTGLVAEIQVRTILQHAWAEIEHDIQYKSADTIPNDIRRRFMSLAGMLEIADREFQAIQDDDERLRLLARKSVQEGRLDEVEITPDALRTYLDKKLGPDGRMTEFSYEFTARLLRTLRFNDFQQIDECIGTYDDDHLSRVVWGTRQGQITRFEFMLLASIGNNYAKFHLWRDQEWFVKSCADKLAKFREAGIPPGSYLPPARRVPNKQLKPTGDPRGGSPAA